LRGTALSGRGGVKPKPGPAVGRAKNKLVNEQA
jgi:hypothetical protein